MIRLWKNINSEAFVYTCWVKGPKVNCLLVWHLGGSFLLYGNWLFIYILEYLLLKEDKSLL